MSHHLQTKFSFEREVVFDLIDTNYLSEPLMSLKVNFTINEALEYAFRYEKISRNKAMAN
ncbi:MAG: hypothetical protein P0S93_04385 [Candidatus Neptunochlamydia sp.]|nr:hypothetical protein [Candidatus Neptunochlamydia sp.]